MEPNTYNPNAVAPPEMKLLYDSIKADGYMMPIVCYYAKEEDKYIIVDGFHRYRVMKEHKDIYEREHGLAALFRDVNFGQAWKPVEDEEESL